MTAAEIKQAMEDGNLIGNDALKVALAELAKRDKALDIIERLPKESLGALAHTAIVHALQISGREPK